jgi:hypothetical protein
MGWLRVSGGIVRVGGENREEEEQMTNNDTPAAAPAPTPTPTKSALQLAISSSLFAAMLGLLFTLFGLLYRAGYLSGFGISTDTLLPESSTDLTFWGYIAVLELSARFRAWTGSAAFLVALGAGVVIALVWGNAALYYEDREPPAFLRRIKEILITRKIAQAAFASTAALLTASFLPWLALAIATVVIGLPAFSYSAGKSAAEKEIANYKAALTTNPERCVTLHNSGLGIGNCLLVIAQTKDRIVYADRDRVRIAWSKDLEPSWSSPELRKQLTNK